jgi:hypothetical protein
MFRSPGAARRSGVDRYGNEVGVYRCDRCSTWHVTSRGIARADVDPLLERLAEALLGRIARVA